MTVSNCTQVNTSLSQMRKQLTISNMPRPSATLHLISSSLNVTLTRPHKLQVFHINPFWIGGGLHKSPPPPSPLSYTMMGQFGSPTKWAKLSSIASSRILIGSLATWIPRNTLGHWGLLLIISARVIGCAK